MTFTAVTSVRQALASPPAHHPQLSLLYPLNSYSAFCTFRSLVPRLSRKVEGWWEVEVVRTHAHLTVSLPCLGYCILHLSSPITDRPHCTIRGL